MAKRIADKELTDRNWDQEEEGEEVRGHVETVSLASGSWNYVSLDFLVLLQAGTFSVASEDVLKNRAIKKAKRRNTGTEVRGENHCLPVASDYNHEVI